MLVVIGAAVVMAGCGDDDTASVGQSASGQKTQTLRIGVFRIDNAMLPPLVDDFTDEYKKAGIETTFETFTDKATAHFALASGKIDVLTGATDAPGTLADQKAPDVRVIAGMYAGVNYVLIAHPDSSLTRYTDLESLKQLKGMTIGDWGQGASRWTVMLLLEAAGLPADYVKYKQLPVSAAGVAAFERGAADIMIQTDPAVHEVIARDRGKIFLDPRTDDTPLLGVPTGALLARSEFIEENRDLLTRFVQATCEGTRQIKADPDGAAKSLATLTGAKPTPAILDGIKSDIPIFSTAMPEDKVSYWLKALDEQIGAFKRPYTYEDTVAPGFESAMSCG